MRVLLVEDDSMVGQAIEDSLKDACYAVDWVKNGQSAISTIELQHYDIILLDLGLPGRDGLKVLTDIRSSGKPVPILIITARDAVEDRVRGLDDGADDYLSKPFEMKELFARMRAVMRRKGGTAAPVLSNSILWLDPATHQVSDQHELVLRLSKREFALLEALMVRPGTILSRAQLEDSIYGWGEEVESNVVEYLIHSLRKKLGNDSIKNIRGVGWMVPRGK
nr:response regulator transcription factor [uncultured Halomonas sp.]